MKSEMEQKLKTQVHSFIARAKIKCADKCGKTAAARHFSKGFPTRGESTVKLLKKDYEVESRRNGLEQEISHLSNLGRPLIHYSYWPAR